MSETLIYVDVPVGQQNEIIDKVISALNSFRSYRTNKIALDYGYANTLAALFAQPPFKHADRIANSILGTFETMAVLTLTVKVGTVNQVYVYTGEQLCFGIKQDQNEHEALVNIIQAACVFSVNNIQQVWCVNAVGNKLNFVLSTFDLADYGDHVTPTPESFTVEAVNHWLALDSMDGSLVSVTEKISNLTKGGFITTMES